MSFFPSIRSHRNPIFPPHHPSPPAAIRPRASSASTTTSKVSWASSALTWGSTTSTKVANSLSKASTARGRAGSASSIDPSNTYCLKLVSLAPSPTLTSPFLSLVVCIEDHPTKFQNATFLYSATNDSNPRGGIPACTPTQHKMIKKILSKTPQHIFHDANFGNVWYILEIQEVYNGEPQFRLFARFDYQVLISRMKDHSSLSIVMPNGQNLYERFDLTHKHKLGNLAYAGYLGEDDCDDNSILMFIKTLDLLAGPGKDGEPIIDRMQQLKGIYNEINLLNRIPMHPYITPPPIGYVTLGSEEGMVMHGRKIIGYVGRYYERGSLSDYLFLPGKPGHLRKPRPISILQKAKWALQITSAMIHLHKKAGICMGDGDRGFGLERFMLDEYMLLHLGGFGAGEVPRTSWRVPPEARIRGEWNLKQAGTHNGAQLAWERNNYIRSGWEQDKLNNDQSPSPYANDNSSIGSYYNISQNNTDSSSTIYRDENEVYDTHAYESSNTSLLRFEKNDTDKTKYSETRGREDSRREEEEEEDERFARKQLAAENDKTWSAFEEWRFIPKATEIVETYSLGIMLWLLFEQVSPDTFLTCGSDPIITWSVKQKIPDSWKKLVEACVGENPGDRVGMEEVLKCFADEVATRWDTGWLMG